MPRNYDPSKSRLILAYFSLISLEAAFFTVSLLLISPDPKNSILLGYSLPRLLMIGCGIALLIAGSYLSIRSFRKPAQIHQVMEHFFTNQERFWNLLALCAVLLAVAFWFLVQGPKLFELRLYVFIRLLPLTILAILLSAQTMVCLLLTQWRIPVDTYRSAATILREGILLTRQIVRDFPGSLQDVLKSQWKWMAGSAGAMVLILLLLTFLWPQIPAALREFRKDYPAALSVFAAAGIALIFLASGFSKYVQRIKGVLWASLLLICIGMNVNLNLQSETLTFDMRQLPSNSLFSLTREQRPFKFKYYAIYAIFHDYFPGRTLYVDQQTLKDLEIEPELLVRWGRLKSVQILDAPPQLSDIQFEQILSKKITKMDLFTGDQIAFQYESPFTTSDIGIAKHMNIFVIYPLAAVGR